MFSPMCVDVGCDRFIHHKDGSLSVHQDLDLIPKGSLVCEDHKIMIMVVINVSGVLSGGLTLATISRKAEAIELMKRVN
jgi:hypothetical protein